MEPVNILEELRQRTLAAHENKLYLAAQVADLVLPKILEELRQAADAGKCEHLIDLGWLFGTRVNTPDCKGQFGIYYTDLVSPGIFARFEARLATLLPGLVFSKSMDDKGNAVSLKVRWFLGSRS